MSAEKTLEEQLSAWLDGELDEASARRVEEALESDPALRELRADLLLLKADLADLGADVAAELEASSAIDWDRVESELVLAPRGGRVAPLRIGPRPQRSSGFGAWLQAAAVLLALGLPILLFGGGGNPRVALAAAEHRFRPLPAPPRRLSAESEASTGDWRFAKGDSDSGTPANGVDLILGRLEAGEPVLVTPELGLLLQAGVTARTRRVIELEVLAPCLSARLRGLDEGLLELVRRGRVPADKSWRAAWLRARRYIAVPGILLEAELIRGPWLNDAVVAAEVELARRGDGRLDSEILGRRLFGADFQLETGYRDHPEARRYALAARRLSRSTLDLTKDSDARVACLLAVAAAEVGEASGWAALEGLLDAEYGRRDAPGLNELRRRLAEAAPGGLDRMEELEEPGRMDELRERLLSDVRARGLDRVSVGAPTALPWRILGGVQTRGALVTAARTSTPRPLPSILDLPAALGSEAALELLTIEGEAPTPVELARLRDRLEAARSTAGWTEFARHRCVEAVLASSSPGRAAASREAGLRSLLLAISTLQTRRPCAALPGSGAGGSGTISPVRVEGPAGYYAALAWSLRGRRRLLGSDLEPGLVGEVSAELERVAALLEAMAVAADRNGELDPIATRDLRTLLPAFRRSAEPASAVLGRAGGPRGAVVLRRRVGGVDLRSLSRSGRRYTGFVFRVEEQRGPELSGDSEQREATRPVERVWWSAELLSPVPRRARDRGDSGDSGQGGR